MNIMRKTIAIIGVLFVLAVVFSGCLGSSDSGSDDPGTTETTQGQQEQPMGDPMGGGDMGPPPDGGAGGPPGGF
jgi:hypothetical protein